MYCLRRQADGLLVRSPPEGHRTAISVQYLFPGWNRAMLQRENRDPPREVVQSVLPVARRQYQSEPPDGRRESERRREDAADRKRVVKGRGGSVSVELGGR